MIFINKNTPYNKRKEIIIVDENDNSKYPLDKKKILKHTALYAFGGIFKVGYDIYKGNSLEKLAYDLIKDEFKLPCLELKSSNIFEFSCIPQKKQLFVAFKELPNFYFNIINIQEQILKYKMEAFLDFCTALGIKEARIVSNNDNKKSRSFNGEGSLDEKTQACLNFNYDNDSKKSVQKSFSFPKPKYELHECNNQFYKLEPDWVKIQNLRLDPLKDITKAEIQIKKQHDISLSAGFKSMMNEQNINLGFNYENNLNEVYIYELEFWEKE